MITGAPIKTSTIKKSALLLFTMAVATGCLQMEDQLVINGNGSGTWKVKVVYGAQLVAMMGEGVSSSNGNDVLMDEAKFRAAVNKIEVCPLS
jgi:hypothetical protein